MLLTTTITAGSTLEFYEKADFFRLLNSASEISVRFYNNGAEVARAESVGEGYAEKFNTGEFDRIQIDSAATQTIQFVTRLGNEVSYDTPPVGNVAVTNNNGAFTQDTFSVTTTSAQVVPANPNRRYFFYQNNSNTFTVYLRFDGGTASSTGGMRLDPGASVEFANFCPTGQINAAASGSSSLQMYMEG